MSIPLDRLYHLFHSLCNRKDIVIYCFNPHGSKNLVDLSRLKTYSDANVFKGKLCNLLMFCHDQEPLDYNLYAGHLDIDDLCRVNPGLADNLGKELLIKNQQMLEQLIPNLNLKIVTGGLDWFTPALLIHSEKRSVNLKLYQNNNYIGVYYWCHAVIAKDWYRYAEYDIDLNKKVSDAKDFLIYNRAWTGVREYRLKFTELLIEHELQTFCRTWFNSVDQDHDYRKHKFQNSVFEVSNFVLEQHFKPSNASSASSADYNTEDYQSTQIEIVLETLFDDNRLHLTEKSMRPIACGQPFILAATHGSLDYLKSYGFETFTPWIDETYDTIQNPIQRLNAIAQEIKRISKLNLNEKSSLFTQLQSIAKRNKEKFFDPKWQNMILEELRCNLTLACDQFDQTIKYPL